ncbi:hypothetical protein G7Y89_g91 [Cudoniella acicularis]|uniref:Heterokaryon incompatibility domain-containing protein n=1 Tax=Cudoniella acicularis TaxID=354080 RepID=A0A8H4RZJ4_9HELO|nr:hypothetical protein G7Y89_g91 [Cudoniella acicularis]
MMLCQFCEGLTIQTLFEIAQKQINTITDNHQFYNFPLDVYYKHQPSYSSLLRSAQNGCELCGFIQQEFKNFPIRRKRKVEGSAWIADIEAEVFEKQEDDLPTDIRICLTSSYCFDHSNPKELSMFDTLLVQAGDEDPVEGVILPVTLRLGTPRKSPVILDGVQIGRWQVDPDLASTENFSIARKWLEECCKDHVSCPSSRETVFPTRLIDVGDTSGLEAARLFITIDQKGNYLALSHCWGGDMPLRLLSSNLQDFCVEIPFDELSANFQDAIKITRELGFRYIWIDSLCIIQDSFLDWENESAKMANIYQNAMLTIAGSMSKKSTEGILKARDSFTMDPASMHHLKLHIGCRASESVSLAWKDDEEEDLAAVFARGSLASRGWTFQERVLSHRVLHYGRRQIYWQCRNGFLAAEGTPEGNNFPQLVDYPTVSEHLASKLQTHINHIDSQKVYNDWYDLVAEYSGKSLTRGSDKFPALAGLATEVALVTNDQYMAGIWRKDWQRGLFWQSEIGKAIHSRTYRAPSWSWAVTDDPILFSYSRHEVMRTRFESFDAELLDYHSALSGKSPFAEIKSASLELRGLTYPLFRSQQIIHPQAPGLLEASVYFDEPHHESPDIFRDAQAMMYRVKTENGEYALLSLGIGFASDTPMEWDNDLEVVFRPKYLLFLISSYYSESEDVHTVIGAKSAEESKLIVGSVAEALILWWNSDKGGFYQRAGYASFSIEGVDELQALTKDWTQQTLNIF